MLPRHHRLRLQKDIATVRRRGQSARGELFMARVLPRGERALASRLAIVVSKKVSAKATERNKVTRWAREVFAEILPKVIVPSDVVLVAHRQFPAYSFDGSKKDIEKIVEKLKLL